jgi:hypothetical protein
MSKKRVNIVEDSETSRSVSSFEEKSKTPASPNKSNPTRKQSSTLNYDGLKGSSVKLDMVMQLNLKLKE